MSISNYMWSLLPCYTLWFLLLIFLFLQVITINWKILIKKACTLLISCSVISPQDPESIDELWSEFCVLPGQWFSCIFFTVTVLQLVFTIRFSNREYILRIPNKYETTTLWTVGSTSFLSYQFQLQVQSPYCSLVCSRLCLFPIIKESVWASCCPDKHIQPEWRRFSWCFIFYQL